MWKVKKKFQYFCARDIESCHCNIFGLTGTVVLSANEAHFFSDVGCSSRHILSKTRLSPFFAFLTKLTHHLTVVKVLSQKIIVGKFSHRHLKRKIGSLPFVINLSLLKPVLLLDYELKISIITKNK